MPNEQCQSTEGSPLIVTLALFLFSVMPLFSMFQGHLIYLIFSLKSNGTFLFLRNLPQTPSFSSVHPNFGQSSVTIKLTTCWWLDFVYSTSL